MENIARLNTRPTANVSVTGEPPNARLQGCATQPGIRLRKRKITAPLNPETQQTNIREVVAATSRRLEGLPEFYITGIDFSIFDEDMLRKTAIKIGSDEEQGLSTVNDERLGKIDDRGICKKCNRNNMDCSGHYGYIELNTPLIHPLFSRNLMSVLTSVCNSCGRLLLTRETLEAKGVLQLQGNARLKKIEELSTNASCIKKYPGENTKSCISNPTYMKKKSKDSIKILCKTNNKEFSRSVEDIEKILRSISDEDAMLLGFEPGDHPKRYIIRIIPVVPTCVRPPVVLTGRPVQDHLSSMYRDIIKFNNRLKENIAENEREKLIERLESSYSHLIDNTDGAYGQNTKEYKSLKQRVQGKEQYIRNGAMGKRVNYTARSVLSPDPTLRYGQIRIPSVFAPFLTVPTRIISANLAKYQQMLKDPGTLPPDLIPDFTNPGEPVIRRKSGTNPVPKEFMAGVGPSRITHITPGSGPNKNKRLKVDAKLQKEYVLKVGDKVERWLQNGDFIVFNRQPTLHKQGIKAHEVVLGKPLSIGLHLADTTSYNADFDGDEGNLHATQSINAMAELIELMNTKNCIMNAQNNRPIVGIVYDSLTAAYLLTQPDVQIDRATFYDCLTELTNTEALPTLEERCKELKVPYSEENKEIKVVYANKRTDIEVPDFNEYIKTQTGTNQEIQQRYRKTYYIEESRTITTVKFSGKALFSALLPVGFYYHKGGVDIVNGVLVNGVITKDHVGTTSGSIIQALWKEYGMERTVDFLTDSYLLLIRWLTNRGFSVGLSDCYPKDDTHEKILNAEINRTLMSIEALGGPRDNPVEEYNREKQIIGLVNEQKNISKDIITKNIEALNALKVMTDSGAKGNSINILQIIAFLGQQFLAGLRMPPTVSSQTRCTPYYLPGDEDPRGRGLCLKSFLMGLSPLELFFHQTAGREGLVDTAVGTSSAGRTHHSNIKLLEDIKVMSDGSVRNAFGTIIQFAYGDDGFAGEHMERIKSNTSEFLNFVNVRRTANRLNAKYGYTNVEQEPLPSVISDGSEIPNEFDIPEPEEAEDYEYGDD